MAATVVETAAAAREIGRAVAARVLAAANVSDATVGAKGAERVDARVAVAMAMAAATAVAATAAGAVAAVRAAVRGAVVRAAVARVAGRAAEVKGVAVTVTVRAEVVRAEVATAVARVNRRFGTAMPASFDAVIVLDGKDIAAPFERRYRVDKVDDDHEALHLSRGSDTCQVALE